MTTNHNFQVKVPTDGYFRIRVTEDDGSTTYVDLSEFGSELLEIGVELNAQERTPTEDPNNGAIIGVYEVSEGVTFWDGENELPEEEAFNYLSEAIVEAVRAVISKVDEVATS